MCPEGNCSPWRGAHAGAGFLAGTVSHGEVTLEQSITKGLHPRESMHAEAVLGELQPVAMTHTGAVHEEQHPVGGSPCWSRVGV